MKRINFLIVLLSVLMLQSCLKERDQVLDPNQVPSVVEFASPGALVHAAADSFRVYSLSYPISPLDTVELTINYAGYQAAPKDVVVNIGINAQLLANYNAAKASSTFVPNNLLPNNTYSLPSSVTIKQGTKNTKLLIPIKVDQISASGVYALPLQITGASGETISGSFGQIIVRVAPKNRWDGVYTFVSGFVQRYSAPGAPLNDALTGNMASGNVTLTTTGPNSVIITGLKWADGGGVGGIADLIATIDPATNQVTMSSTVTSTSLRSTPGKVNSYDPATGTFTLNFDWNPTGATREITNLVFRYSTSR